MQLFFVTFNIFHALRCHYCLCVWSMHFAAEEYFERCLRPIGTMFLHNLLPLTWQNRVIIVRMLKCQTSRVESSVQQMHLQQRQLNLSGNENSVEIWIVSNSKPFPTNYTIRPLIECCNCQEQLVPGVYEGTSGRQYGPEEEHANWEERWRNNLP